jgi:hypothetical protein
MDAVKLYVDKNAVLVPTGSFSAAANATAADTEREIVAKANGKRQVPLNCEFRVAADCTELITVSLYADDGSTETLLWRGYFNDSDVAGTVIGFTQPKKVPAGANLSYTAIAASATTSVQCNCDYMTLDAK